MRVPLPSSMCLQSISQPLLSISSLKGDTNSLNLLSPINPFLAKVFLKISAPLLVRNTSTPLESPSTCKLLIAAPYPTRPDWRIRTRSRETRSSLSFPIQIQKKKIQYNCEYIFNTKCISNTHWAYVKLYIKHFYGN